MKTTLFTLLAFLFLLSCKNPDWKNTTVESTQLAASASINRPNVGENTADNSSTSHDFILTKNTSQGWTPEEKTTFMVACEEGTSEKLGERQSTNYCACLLSRLEKLYPVADDVINLPDKKQQELSKECQQ